MYDVLYICLDIVLAFLRGWCLQYYYGSFLEGRMKRKYLTAFLVTFLYGCVRFGMDVIQPLNYGNIGIILNIVFSFFILVGLALCFYEKSYTITAFLATTFLSVMMITLFLSQMLIQAGDKLIDLWAWLMENGYITSTIFFKNLVQITVLVLRILFYGVHILLLFNILKKIDKSFVEKNYRIQKTELYFLLTPGIIGLMFCVLLRIIMVTAENDIPEMLYDKYPVLLLIVPGILFFSLLSIVYSVKLFQDMIALNREKSGKIIMEKQIGNMQEHILEMERINSGIRSMKHDMKNTLAVIMQLAGQERQPGQDQENVELKAYLSEISRSFDQLDYKFRTGNIVVDTLMNMKYHEAVRLIPDIEINADALLFPENLMIQSFDCGIIIGNALDNAIEACRELKAEQPQTVPFIRMTSYLKGKMLLLEVENSFNGKIVIKKQSDFPVTDKPDKKAHGMGFLNMKRTAEKYHGAVDWSVNGKVFVLSVMMKNESPCSQNSEKRKEF